MEAGCEQWVEPAGGSGEAFISVIIRFEQAAGLDSTMLGVTFYFCWSQSSRLDCGQSIRHNPSRSPSRFSVLCRVTSCHVHLNQSTCAEVEREDQQYER